MHAQNALMMAAAMAAGVEPLGHVPHNSNPMLDMIGGDLGSIMNKLRKNRQRELRAAAGIHENNRFCRKNKCGLFKTRQCWKKTYEQQCECERTKGYEKEEVLTPEVV